MRNLSIVLMSIMASVATAAQAQERSPIVRLDSGLDAIVPRDAKVEKLADNFRSNECPLWVRNGGYLLFRDSGDPGSNVPNNMLKWSPGDGKVSLFLQDMNCVTLDRQGRGVYIRGDAERQIVRVENDGRRTVLATEFEGKRLTALNDLVYKSDGALYVTNADANTPSVYVLRDGKLREVIKDMRRPNGLAFSPDEKYLYVADTFAMTIMRFDVQPDDTLSRPRLLIDENADKAHPYPDHGFPDGMKVDQQGNIYCGGPGGLWIISPEGKHLGTILFSENDVDPRPAIGVANLAFGDADGKALYLTVRTALYRIRLNIPGIRP
jgi:gluconolactonase